jgi:ParB family chromosome partitioning protein
VRGIIQLLAKGEERLLVAVEKGQIPVSIAIAIATTSDKEVQRALAEAYERNDLRGKALLRARRLIETRRAHGKARRTGQRKSNGKAVSADTLLKTYQEETIRQKLLVQKAKVCEARLMFAVTALRQLFLDENFVTLLRAENLDSVPQYLADKLSETGVKP